MRRGSSRGNGSGGVFRRLRKVKVNFAVALFGAIFVCSSVQPAFALEAGTNVTIIDGTVAVPNALTAASPAAAAGLIPISAAGDRSMTYVTANGTATKKYLYQTSGGTPAFDQVAIGDIAGTPSGSGNLVLTSGPSIANITLTGTVTLPADAVDVITDIAAGIKTGTSATKLVTIAAGSTTTSTQCAVWDANNNLTSQACSTGSVNSLVVSESETPFSAYATSTNSYMGLGGRLAATDISRTRTPVPAGTWDNLRCTTDAVVSGAGIVVTAGKGDCTGALTFATLTTIVTAADTVSTAGTAEISTTAGQCLGFQIVKPSGQVSGNITCTMERTANS